MIDPVRLGPGREFDLIGDILEQDERIRRERSTGRPQRAAGSPGRVLSGPGGDCAVVAGRAIAISVDASIEDTHFRRDWLTARQIGYRSAAAALSDLAAVAASPIGLFVTLAIRADDVPGFALEVMAGVSEAAAASDARLLGGDVARSTGPLMIDITVTGEVGRSITRSGAKPGHAVWVTGRLGAPAAAVRAWNAGETPSPDAVAAFARPSPRIAEAGWLARHELITAAIDLSDGLAGDAAHLAAAGGVRILLEAAAIPIASAALDSGIDSGDALQLALGGGEDYELCFTAPAGVVEREASAFEARFGIALTRVGRVVEGRGVALVDAVGVERDLDIAGYNHFTTD